MNIKEIKANTEKAVNIVLRSMVGPEVKVENSYNLETNTMNVGLVNETKGNSNEIVIAQYNFAFDQEKDMLTFGAIARHIYSDYAGIYTVNYEPIYIDETFIANIKEGVKIGMERTDEVLAQEAQRLAAEAVEESDDEVEAEATVIDGNEGA